MFIVKNVTFQHDLHSLKNLIYLVDEGILLLNNLVKKYIKKWTFPVEETDLTGYFL